MSPRSARITLFSTFAVLGLTACLLAQYKEETAPSEKADPRTLSPSTTITNPPLTFESSQRQIPHVIPRTVYVTEMRPLTKQEEQEHANYAQLFKSLQDAKDDAGRQPIADKIKGILIAKFDRDLAEREKEIKAVEERVAALRKQQEKRALMKDEIISVRLKAILFKAEGLDLPLNFPSVPVTVPTSGLPSDLYRVPISPTPNPTAPTYDNQPQAKPVESPKEYTPPAKKLPPEQPDLR